MPDQRVNPPARSPPPSPASANIAGPTCNSNSTDTTAAAAAAAATTDTASSCNASANPAFSSSSSSSSSSLSSTPPARRRRLSPVIIIIVLPALVVLILSALIPVLRDLWVWGSTTTAMGLLASQSAFSGGCGCGGGGGSDLSRGGGGGGGGGNSGSASGLASSVSCPSLPSPPSPPSLSSLSSSPSSHSSPPSSTLAPLSLSLSSSSSSSLASLDPFYSVAPPPPPPSSSSASSTSSTPSTPSTPSTSSTPPSTSQSQPQSQPPPSSGEKSPVVKQHYPDNTNTDNNNAFPHPHHNPNHHNESSAMTSTSVIVAATAKDDLNHVPTLPPTTDLTYLAEGAANVIYRLSSPPGAPQYPNQLLRLRKALPSAQPNKLAYAHLLHTFHPLFPAHLLLPTSLIRIPASVLARENDVLRSLEAAGKRPAKRVGLYLEEVDEQFGFLIMDMSPHPLPTPPSSPGLFARVFSFFPGRLSKRAPSPSSSDPDLSLPAHAQRTRQLLIEFKPKWVLQSRSAPDGWHRCRTCALRLSKQQKRGFCPLDLASGDEARVRRAVAQIVPARQPANLVLGAGMSWEDTRAVIQERMVRYVLEGDLMVELKRLHAELDPYGPVAVQSMGREVRERFVSAMTVRDLTIFLRIDLEREEGEAGAVEARIGDLDLKTGDAGKWAYWAGVEAKLREEGYYGGTEEGAEERGVWCKL